MSTTPTTPAPPPAWQADAEAAQAGLSTLLATVDPPAAVVETALFNIVSAAVKAWTAASAAPVTVAQLQALLPDAPLDPPATT